MKKKAVAIIDGTLFDNLIEIKSVMEQSDKHFNDVEFIHKDKLSEAKASGDFISAPLAFIVVPINNKEDYKRELEKAKIIKNEFNISVCTLIFTASAEIVFADEINDVNFMGYKVFDLVTSLHVIHENYSPKEEAYIKILALISGLSGSCPSANDVAFNKDYVTVCIKVNYENLNAAYLLSFEKMHSDVEDINQNISKLKEEIEQFRHKKSKKYSCRFSAREYPPSKDIIPSVPKKTEDLLTFCKTYATTLSRTAESFSQGSNSDITVARHALSKSFKQLCEKDEVDPDVLEITPFSENENPYTSEELIERAFQIKTPKIYKVNGLIPLLKTIANTDGINVKRGLKMILLLLLCAVFAVCAYIIPSVIKSGTAMITNPLLYILVGFIAMILIAAGTALLIEIFSKNKLINHLKKLVDENTEFFTEISATDKSIRDYINKFVTISINSFVKTKKIDILEKKITDLKMQKEIIMEVVRKLRNRMQIFETLCETDLYAPETVIDSDELIELVNENSNTDNTPNIDSPKIEKCIWIKEILFELA